jgi:hypothetical protein
MFTEEEKKKFIDHQNKMDRRDAERKEANSKHIQRIEGFKTLEEVLGYWSENCAYCSFFNGLFGDGVSYKVEDVFKDRKSRLKVLEAEMKRIENFHLMDLLSTKFYNEFNLRLKTDSKAYKTAKKAAFADIKRMVDVSQYKDWYTKLRNKGFKAYKGGKGFEVAVNDLNLLSLGIENRKGFKHIYEGYLLAQLKEKIKHYHDEAITSERIKVNITAKKFAALMYILSQKGVFELSYFDFNSKYYNGESTARFIQKHFEILSQQGATKGGEVDFKSLNQAFKPSVIKSTKGDGVNNLFKALDELPKLTK